LRIHCPNIGILKNSSYILSVCPSHSALFFPATDGHHPKLVRGSMLSSSYHQVMIDGISQVSTGVSGPIVELICCSWTQKRTPDPALEAGNVEKATHCMGSCMSHTIAVDGLSGRSHK
jgi:hypothetical protein